MVNYIRKHKVFLVLRKKFALQNREKDKYHKIFSLDSLFILYLHKYMECPRKKSFTDRFCKIF